MRDWHWVTIIALVVTLWFAWPAHAQQHGPVGSTVEEDGVVYRVVPFRKWNGEETTLEVEYSDGLRPEACEETVVAGVHNDLLIRLSCTFSDTQGNHIVQILGAYRP